MVANAAMLGEDVCILALAVDRASWLCCQSSDACFLAFAAVKAARRHCRKGSDACRRCQHLGVCCESSKLALWPRQRRTAANAAAAARNVIRWRGRRAVCPSGQNPAPATNDCILAESLNKKDRRTYTATRDCCLQTAKGGGREQKWDRGGPARAIVAAWPTWLR